MASKIREDFSAGNSAGGPLGWQARDGPTTKEHGGTVSRHLPDWGPNCSPSPIWGSGKGGGAWRQRWSRPWRHGECGSGSRDVLRHHGIQPGRRNGACVLSNKKGEKRPVLFPFVTFPWSGGTAVLSFFGFSSPPRASLSNASKPHGDTPERTSAGESWGRKSGDCSRGRKDEALRWTFKPSRGEAFAMIPGFWSNLHIFLGGAPPGWNSFLAPEQCTRARGCQKVSILLRFGCFPGPVLLDEEGGAWTPAVVPFVAQSSKGVD
ncbi:hypothetical protein GWK47_013521 [Chionoecetes opilio]|uniref:Uncharacterized protein n=1 Tax=Chionoecetes opilio TaxID=41210 RepID=A0A8J4XUB5_CHIOP|nr:hypothetical protein GWK47_013521 [Chionoecetes opilio]